MNDDSVRDMIIGRCPQKLHIGVSDISVVFYLNCYRHQIILMVPGSEINLKHKPSKCQYRLFLCCCSYKTGIAM